MITIPISGIIASYECENESNVTPTTLRESLEKANGENVLITINSAGGSVFHGLEMFSLIRNYPGNTETRIISLAASMGSVLALAGQKKSIENTALYYIHNAWGLAIGDYRVLEKEAKFLKDISGLISELYAENTTLNKLKAQKLMDDESQFYGEQLVELGFELVQTNQNNSENMLLSKNKDETKKYCLKKMKEKIKPKNYMEDLEKVAASISMDKFNNFVDTHLKQSVEKELITASADENKQEVIMNLEEFKKNHSELYAKVVQIGKDEERDRVTAHITMGEQAGCLDIAVKNIKDGKGFTSAISAEYMAAGMKKQSLQNRKDDDVDTGGQAGEDDESDTKVYTEKLLKARGLK